jgi:hypothetical protein
VGAGGPDDGECYVAAKVGVLRVRAEAAGATGLYAGEPFGPELLVLGTIKLEVEGAGWRLFRLPSEMGLWALEQVENAGLGRNAFPAFFALRASDGTFEVRLASMRDR